MVWQRYPDNRRPRLRSDHQALGRSRREWACSFPYESLTCLQWVVSHPQRANERVDDREQQCAGLKIGTQSAAMDTHVETAYNYVSSSITDSHAKSHQLTGGGANSNPIAPSCS